MFFELVLCVLCLQKVRRFLTEALQIDRSQSCCSEEGYVRLYVDIIQVRLGCNVCQNVSVLFGLMPFRVGAGHQRRRDT